ncbi:MAG: hypothetical protein LBJ17_04660 [Dysgonamonadaceae bacterium]|jgi:major membrane immunogen (membrane-anchored lipoprotein)|nr:hypothetical protein [Dysgonamonadaceae bacterium]
MKKKLKIGLIGLSLLFFSCDKNDTNLTIEEGVYSGTFSVKYSEGSISEITTLELKNGKFTCTTGGSGNYTVTNSKIIFEDVYYRVDWNLILNGEYNYTFNGKKLKFSNNVGNYKYDLEKQ